MAVVRSNRCARCGKPVPAYPFFHGQDFFCSYGCFAAPRTWDDKTIPYSRAREVLFSRGSMLVLGFLIACAIGVACGVLERFIP